MTPRSEMLKHLIVMFGNVFSIAEYYNQHPISYEDDGTEVVDVYSGGNIEPQALPVEESVVSRRTGHYEISRETDTDEFEKKHNTKTAGYGRLESPIGAIKSLRVGRVRTNPENIGDLLYGEMADMNPDFHNKLAKTLAHNSVDHKKYRDLFIIKKRVIDDGRRKIISFNIKEKIVPKEEEGVGISKDFWMKALFGGGVFLLAGLAFTTTLKTYENIIRKNYFDTSSGEKYPVRS